MTVLAFDRPGSLERPESDWFRDDAGRPWIKPDPEWDEARTQAWLAAGDARNGERPYTRVTTFVEALLDGTMLARWKMRRVALGMGRRPDYVVAAAALTAEDRDRKALNDLAEKALEAAGPNAADIGTALHSFTERIDRGEPVGEIPAAYAADLDAYREQVQKLTWAHREERMVCDALEVAGTPDGIATCAEPDPDGVIGQLHIVDLKTGNVERTAGKFSAQLGVYANSALYDPATGRRTRLENLSTRWGLVLHMPAGLGTAELRWLNIEHGWLGAQLAGPVRRWRTVNHADLMRPLVPPPPRTVPDGKCAGRKRDGEPCSFKAVAGGFCARHADQADEDQTAPVPRRAAEVAAELRKALDDVPDELRMAVAKADTWESEDAADLDGTDDVPGWGVGRPLTDDDLPPEMLQPEQNGNPTPRTSMPDPETAEQSAQAAELALMDQVRACRTSGELAMLYERTGSAWTDQVKRYASRHQLGLAKQAAAERTGAALFAAISACETQGDLQALWDDPRNDGLWTNAHSDLAKARWQELPPF